MTGDDMTKNALHPVIRQLVAARKERGWDQRAVARKLGCVQSHVCSIETGVRNPTMKFLAEYAGLFDGYVRVIFPVKRPDATEQSSSE